MRFYRGLSKFQIISFDLDDTLYDNRPVITQAEQAFVDYLAQRSGITHINLAYWQDWKHRVEQQNPLLCEDVVQWRRETLRQLLQAHQQSAVEIEKIIADSLHQFVLWRHQISLPEQSIEVLNQLAEKYAIVALTNGNVEPAKIGLPQFRLVLRGGEHGRAKPHQDLFYQACEHFNIAPQQLLHIGDNLFTDVQGAIQAGCQAVWLNNENTPLIQHTQTRLLPNLEITQLNELLALKGL
ncbi:putative hydrolase of the HAD superfamily [Volucribacter psittacicida]|uniref:Putative hydrolase of the HAD superfamily n=1 Tax=Volucribacter psittacicida TaxID=203482 RepID=A0A4V2PBM5_9PAST|nr:5-amino-6-(5-phospho-D-ribitylamino)uracil phosphatase YigB [Volucribacter psittacicida]TCJ98025.1 putative hydrolase of the HAD superfamily [Volucribacter psittacicida]